MSAPVLPAINWHWLPGVIANPNLAINPSHLVSLQSKSSSQPSPVTPAPGPHVGSALVPAPSPGVAPVSTVSGMPVSAGVAPAQASPTGSLPGAVMRANLYGLVPQEAPHFESDVPGGNEANTGLPNPPDVSYDPSSSQAFGMDSELLAARAAGVPGDVVPISRSPTTSFGAATTRPVEPNLGGLEVLPDSEKYIAEIEDIISPKGVIFNVTISTVILSAFVFIAVLAWFEVIRTWYDQTFDPVLGVRDVNIIFVRFWYAVFVSSIIIILVYVMHRWAKS